MYLKGHLLEFQNYIEFCFLSPIFYAHFEKKIGRVILFVCFVALRPKSTAMVIVGRSVHLRHFFLGRLGQADNK